MTTTEKRKKIYRFPPVYQNKQKDASSPSSSSATVDTIDWSYTVEIRINTKRVEQVQNDPEYKRPVKNMNVHPNPFTLAQWSSFILL